ncbi:O-acetylhomoserine/O-acetylserine sulfhydrylase [Martensiomyces pterosporus]|nr:O-acetylhomoserine/O-acetylserine sulfhydrylase [Martensiomyces pterosporus]
MPPSQEPRKYHFDTLALHAGQTPDPTTRSRAVPLYQTTSYVFESSEQCAKLFSFEEDGYVYSRVGNPTNEVFERRMAALEGGVGALATSSGTAANFLVLATLCLPGDNVVSTSYIHGGTVVQYKHAMPSVGIDVRMADGDSAEVLERLMDERTRAVFVETIGNPRFNVPDLRKVADLAHKWGVPLIVDNTFGMGGYIVRPLEHGADIVTHSATKWIQGHGTTIGGVVVDGGTFSWNNGKFPCFTRPSASFNGLSAWDMAQRQHGGVSGSEGKNHAFMLRLRSESMRDFGPCATPFAAWMFLQGLETLPLRAERHNKSAIALARWLETRGEVAWVSYPGLESHPYHESAKRYLGDSFGGVLSFGVKGGPEAGAKLMDALVLTSPLANVGDAKTLALHPATTTHKQLTPAQQLASGVSPDMIRVSVGLERVDDIMADFDQALRQSQL